MPDSDIVRDAFRLLREETVGPMTAEASDEAVGIAFSIAELVTQNIVRQTELLSEILEELRALNTK